MRTFVLLIFACLSFAFSISAQTKVPKTVADFYYLLPNDRFAPFDDGSKKIPSLYSYRKSIIKIEDIKNGYIKIEADWDGWAEIVIFKKTNGDYIVGVSSVACGPVCGSSVEFLSYKNGQWKDVTEQIFPKITEAQVRAAYEQKNLKVGEEGLPELVYNLPRVGKTITVDTDGTELDYTFKLTWNGSKFILQNK